MKGVVGAKGIGRRHFFDYLHPLMFIVSAQMPYAQKAAGKKHGIHSESLILAGILGILDSVEFMDSRRARKS